MLFLLGIFRKTKQPCTLTTYNSIQFPPHDVTLAIKKLNQSITIQFVLLYLLIKALPAPQEVPHTL